MRRIASATEACVRFGVLMQRVRAEILYSIEQSLRPRRLPAAELEQRLHGIHARLEGPAFSIEEIDAAKREGRP